MPISLITHLTDVRIVRGQSPLANQHPELFSRLQLDPAQQDQSSSSLTPSSGFSLSTSEHGSTSPECSTVVKSCKHCSFSFRIDDKQKDGLDYCSKGMIIAMRQASA